MLNYYFELTVLGFKFLLSHENDRDLVVILTWSSEVV